jgi:hypothetical protein
MPRQKEAILSNIWPLSLNWTQERQLKENQRRMGFVPRIYASQFLLLILPSKYM